MQEKKIFVIGGGASGFFAAINSAINFPDCKVVILEKTNNLLSKVKISGGGRCNVSNNTFDNSELVKYYPRGEKELRQVFSQFSVTDTIKWFNDRGVKLKTESDGRVFPESNLSKTIIDLFLSEAKKRNIEIKLNEEVLSIKKSEKLILTTKKNKFTTDKVICCVGGFHQSKYYEFLKILGHTVTEIVPSLFTLNIKKDEITNLMGLSVKNGVIKIVGTKFKIEGAILITHWGFSGPAVLKLSAFAAYEFFKSNYNLNVSISWVNNLNVEEIAQKLKSFSAEKQLIANSPKFEIPKRLWEYLLVKSGINLKKHWNEISKKEINNFAKNLFDDVYYVLGKTKFKEEFVTAGGVSLKEINFKTMESKIFSGLYFCGEVINVDGITGGFNFQNAWSTAWVAAKNN
ncbi:MAG: NAD(P)/FAD-dependent oxidoreductase [Bacteroidetes bacterium]|nr:NAD(P)/FAD-dependent oxidoreductase [Bacteroidota bacterium]